MSSIQTYLKDLSSLFSITSSEYSYRTPFENYLREIFPESEGYRIKHEDKTGDGNKPDFMVAKKNGDNLIPLLYIEVKDIGKNLDTVEKSNQASRYFWYDNLIIADYLEFRFYRYGQSYEAPILLGKSDRKTWKITPEKIGNAEILERRMRDFASTHKEKIKSATHLAKIMWGKAQRVRDNLREMMENTERHPDIWKLYHTFKSEILHDLSYDDFADLYAQTLVYGLFVARYHDQTPDTFSRSEARDLVPKSNPLLRRFFDHIAGEWYEKRLEYIVDELCEVFAHADVHALMHGLYQKETHDPVIHFYEDFLGEYDDNLRKLRGVFYTPAPVVKFIIRAVDDVLRTHFNLPKGLADTSKIKVEREIQKYDKKWERKTEIIETHRVQILDPATGTGTFLDEIVRHIHSKMSGQAGMWPSYVNHDLLPRLHGFELMMASYTIAHLKLGLTLAETGVPDLEKRLQIYLTNSLEEAKTKKEDQGTLFGLLESITDEAKQADEVKRNKPIMVIVGNPPYSGESGNKGLFEKELNAYKQEPGGGKLQEKNSKWLNDDYVKFFRFAESMIEKNREWVMGFITNHSYLDNPTFRGMRWHLLQTFDHIHIVDLHGNAKKKETSLDGSKDENVFDIMQGTAIFIGIKTGKKREWELAEVLHIDQYGKRQAKYDWLESSTLLIVNEKLELSAPNYNFTYTDFSNSSEYGLWFWIGELFSTNTIGIVTWDDKIFIWKSTNNLLQQLTPKNTLNLDTNLIKKISYRPFESKFIYYDNNLLERSRYKIMKHMLETNIALVSVKRTPWKSQPPFIFLSKDVIINWYIRSDSVSIDSIFPLYLYSDSVTLDWITKIPNLEPVIWKQINESIGKETTPEDILDYIYAVLHSPSYRNKYREFLKIDFPRVPYPDALVRSTPSPSRGECRKVFDALVKLGGELRALHLLKSPKVEEYITTFPVAGSGEVEKVIARDSPLWGVSRSDGVKAPEESRSDGVKAPEVSRSDGMVAQDSPLEGSPKAGVVALNRNIPSWVEDSLFPYWSLPKSKNLKERTKELRKQWILSEVLFWQAFKDKKRLWWDIDRQVIIGNYIVDFWIPELWLVFEIDGSSHEWREEYDTERDAFLRGHGLQIIRILDGDVKNNLEWVSELVTESIKKRKLELETTTPPPIVGTPQRGELSASHHSRDALTGKLLDIYINSLQYFGDVPEVAWNHYIGGYQPAQKWLKDRKWRTLTWEDISHYQSMIVALTETSRVMGEVDGVLESR